MEIIKKLNDLLDRQEKKQYILLFLLMLISAGLEVFGLSMIIPFINLVINPSYMEEQPFVYQLYELLNFESYQAFLITATFALLSIFIFKNFFLYSMYSFKYRLTNNQQAIIASRLYSTYLKRPYTFFLNRNSAELLRNTNEEVGLAFTRVIQPFLILATETLVLLAIAFLLLTIEPAITATAILVLGTFVFLFFTFQRKKMNQLAQEQRNLRKEKVKWLKQGFEGGKEIKVNGKEKFFIEAFQNQAIPFAQINRYFQVIREVPKLFIESLVVVTILLITALVILQGDTSQSLLPTLALYSMAAFRLMPSIQKIAGSMTQIKNGMPSLETIHSELVELEDEKKEKSESNLSIAKAKKPTNNKFCQAIELKNIYFRYPNVKEYNINNVSLTIPLGKSVAFIGPSGAGKTTLVDIILGLLQPEKGQVRIDGMDIHQNLAQWQQKIGYIPQSIYLSDDTIRNNVAFGFEVEQIDDEALWQALDGAQLKSFVEKLPLGLDTIVGERGVRLSGGQRQRIGIARALYHNPEILFLDEATSSLDSETEKGVMEAIEGLRGEKTLIIIAHRLSTIEHCDLVYEIRDGQLV
ncbi:ABC transporter ATP-binding protein [Heliorestis acidaminivorans]|uniref:ABC transporter ATP-binding protein n=1 Tax=Heliorestis acidaminivorans TaxID=553427 RepID=A0A6I0EUE0_9FIRM|nr:ABC transporter ATP-binding protein [Heliorestis acidaminivorans]KAB2952913.1 ABC transporter ATP-binding protein [Heliorestis acidaminivorans]